MKSITFIFLILGLSYCALSERVPYAQFVFPQDINKFPLLFLETIVAGEDALTNRNVKLNEDNDEIDKFIMKQKKSRDVEHLRIAFKDLDSFKIDKYRYVIQPLSTVISVQGTSYSKNRKGISYVVFDREKEQYYHPFGKGRWDASKESDYRKISPQNSKDYFKSLTRVCKHLDKHSIEKTFKREMSIQRRPLKIFVVTGIIMFGGAYGAYFATS